MEKFDLLSAIDSGGCSAKIDPVALNKILAGFPLIKDKHILVGASTHDDAAVYQISDDKAIIFTTDFFPPICSDPGRFGRIAAANALSDVYAMGGKPIMALNLVMFPSSKPLEVLSEILKGGMEKVEESGAMIVGGHTIDDNIPKYGLAVVGLVNPQKLITNDKMKEGNLLVLTKPLGTATILAASKQKFLSEHLLEKALSSMEKLNAEGSLIMQKYNVKGATDITGFGLLGHAMQSAEESGVTFVVSSSEIPVLDGAKSSVEMGCIPGATFRNLKYVSSKLIVSPAVSQNDVYIMADAQTSGGLLFDIEPQYANQAVEELKQAGYNDASIIGEVIPKRAKPIYIQ